MLIGLNKHGGLSASQFRFSKAKLIVDTVMGLAGLVVEQKKVEIPPYVFLDLTKAFECVDREILMEILESHGIREVPRDWLSSSIKEEESG